MAGRDGGTEGRGKGCGAGSEWAADRAEEVDCHRPANPALLLAGALRLPLPSTPWPPLQYSTPTETAPFVSFVFLIKNKLSVTSGFLNPKIKERGEERDQEVSQSRGGNKAQIAPVLPATAGS